MSHFSIVKTKLINRDCLVEALVDLGLSPQVHEIAQPLTGYYGSEKGESAEIIVPGSMINACADIGFRWNPSTGMYETIHDAYETVPRLGENFFTNQLMLAYGKRMILAKCKQLHEELGECEITEQTKGNIQTLRLTFSSHQTQQYTRR